MVTEPNGPAAVSPVRDRREPPRGTLPRQLQMWLMAGLAVVIILVVLVAGRSQSSGPASSTIRPVPAALPDADRIRAYQQQLAEDESRLRQVQKEAMTPTGPPSDGGAAQAPTV